MYQAVGPGLWSTRFNIHSPAWPEFDNCEKLQASFLSPFAFSSSLVPPFPSSAFLFFLPFFPLLLFCRPGFHNWRRRIQYLQAAWGHCLEHVRAPYSSLPPSPQRDLQSCPHQICFLLDWQKCSSANCATKWPAWIAFGNVEGLNLSH